MNDGELFDPGFLRPDRAFFSGRRAVAEPLPEIRSGPSVQLAAARSTRSVLVVSVIATISWLAVAPSLGTGSTEPSRAGPGSVKMATRSGGGFVGDHERSWLAFLDALGTPDGSATPAQADLVRSFWKRLLAEAGDSVAAPTTAGRSDEGFVLVWDRSEHHLDVDLLDEGSLEWFYSNRRTELFEGQEGLLTGAALPEPILRYLKLFA
jgi:hypothetical protein